MRKICWIWAPIYECCLDVSFHLDALTAGDCELLRRWRNRDEARAAWRTPYVLTEAMQADFYRDVVSNRNAPHRYWAIRGEPFSRQFYGLAGLSNIEWENSHAEISLHVDPDARGKGIGTEAVRLVLREAFERMSLATVFGEVYSCNPSWTFWRRQVARFCGEGVLVPRRKLWDGVLHGSWFFWFTREGWANTYTPALEVPQLEPT